MTCRAISLSSVTRPLPSSGWQRRAWVTATVTLWFRVAKALWLLSGTRCWPPNVFDYNLTWTCQAARRRQASVARVATASATWLPGGRSIDRAADILAFWIITVIAIVQCTVDGRTPGPADSDWQTLRKPWLIEVDSEGGPLWSRIGPDPIHRDLCSLSRVTVVMIILAATSLPGRPSHWQAAAACRRRTHVTGRLRVSRAVTSVWPGNPSQSLRLPLVVCFSDLEWLGAIIIMTCRTVSSWPPGLPTQLPRTWKRLQWPSDSWLEWFRVATRMKAWALLSGIRCWPPNVCSITTMTCQCQAARQASVSPSDRAGSAITLHGPGWSRPNRTDGPFKKCNDSFSGNKEKLTSRKPF